MHRHRSTFFTKTLVYLEDPTVSDDLVERVNCRRVVFHPYCRGISAKRSLLQLQNGNTKPTANAKTDSVEELKPLNEWESMWHSMIEAQNLQHSAIEQQHQIIRSMLPRLIGVGDGVDQDHQHDEYHLIDADHTSNQRREQQQQRQQQLPPYLFNIPSIMADNVKQTGNSNRQARQQRLLQARMNLFPHVLPMLPIFQHQISSSDHPI